MILRGAVLSDERLSLASNVQRTALDVLASSSTALPLEAARASDAARIAEPLVIERLVPAEVDFHAVVEWLKTGDARQQLVDYLAGDLEAVRSAAEIEGFAAGEAAGKAAGAASAEAHMQAVLETLGSLTARAELAFQKEADDLASICADVVCAALGKIAGPVLSMREAALGTVLEVLKRVKDERELTIRVSVHDLPALEEQQEEIQKACAGRLFSLVADARVEAGGCIVESSLGTLDGRFDVQLRGLAETLRVAKSAASERP
jgi:flagellar assembly protein FliH